MHGQKPKKEVQYIKNSTKKGCKVIQEATHLHASAHLWGFQLP